MAIYAGKATAKRQYSRNWEFVKLPNKKKDGDSALEQRVIFTPIMGPLHEALCAPWLKANPNDPRVQERLSSLSHWNDTLKSIPCLMEQEAKLNAAGEVEINYIEGERNRCEKVHLTWGGGKTLHSLVNDYGFPNQNDHLRVWLWSAPPPDDPELAEWLTSSKALTDAVEGGLVPNFGRPAIMRVRNSVYKHMPACTKDPDRMDASDYAWVIRLARPDDNLQTTYYINNLDSAKAAREEYAGRTWALPSACAKVFRKVMEDNSDKGFLNSYVPDYEDNIDTLSDHVVAMLQEAEALACSKCLKPIPKQASLASIDWRVGPTCPNGCAGGTKASAAVADIGVEAPGSEDDPFANIAADVDLGQ